MTRFQVDSEAVLAATGAVRNTITRLQAEASSLDHQLAELQGSWTGQAASAFQSVISDWKVTQQRVEQSLAAINRGLGRAAQQYADIEQANASLFR